MSDAPRNRQRQPNRLNRPHAGQSLDPTLTRKGVLAHPGSLFVGFGALVFFAYVFNVGGLQTFLDGFFGGLDNSAKSHNNEVATFVIASLPYVGVALGAVVLFIVLSMLSRGAKSIKKRHKLSSREEVSLHEFEDEAAKHGISKKVAREAYEELLPHYHGQMRVTLKDRMPATLQLKPVEISELYGNLLRKTDRQRKVGDDGASIETVLDLIKAVEESKKRSLTQSRLHERAGGTAARKRPSLGARVKHTLMHSVLRKAAPADATKPKDRQLSFIRPARLAKKESEIESKPAESNNESPAAG